MRPEDVLSFWFTELTSEQWWKKDAQLDQKIRERFLPFIEAAARGELVHWRTTARGRVAEILLLDQFPRNVFRGTARAFATDSMALVLAQELVTLDYIKKIPLEMRAFALMPYMHSESRKIHNDALKLFTEYGLEGNLDFEIQHKRIIDQFGRYPHRNQFLGRHSTPEEIDFMKTHHGF